MFCYRIMLSILQKQIEWNYHPKRNCASFYVMTNESQLFAGEQLYIYVDPDGIFHPNSLNFCRCGSEVSGKTLKATCCGLNHFPLLTETPFHGNHQKFPGSVSLMRNCTSKSPETAVTDCWILANTSSKHTGSFDIFRHINPIGSMYGIFTYIWLICMVNVGKYTIHGSYGNLINDM